MRATEYPRDEYRCGTVARSHIDCIVSNSAVVQKRVALLSVFGDDIPGATLGQGQLLDA